MDFTVNGATHCVIALVLRNDGVQFVPFIKRLTSHYGADGMVSDHCQFKQKVKSLAISLVRKRGSDLIHPPFKFEIAEENGTPCLKPL